MLRHYLEMPLLASRIRLNRWLCDICKYYLLKSHHNWLGGGGQELKFLLSFLEKKYQISQMIPGDGNIGKHSSGVRSFNGRL